MTFIHQVPFKEENIGCHWKTEIKNLSSNTGITWVCQVVMKSEKWDNNDFYNFELKRQESGSQILLSLLKISALNFHTIILLWYYHLQFVCKVGELMILRSCYWIFFRFSGIKHILIVPVSILMTTKISVILSNVVFHF